MQFHPPLRPAETAESQLIEAILNNTFPINSTLPAERELARQLGVTRPTLREALQRLSRDGWIEIRHGKSTRVRDYLREGNLTILGTIARGQQALPPNFVSNLLQIRALLAPTYFRMAMENYPLEVLGLLASLQEITDDSVEFTRLDWNLHSQMTLYSQNPVFSLIFNGFSDLYKAIGPLYFTNPVSRELSRSFYKNLYNLAVKQDLNGFESETQRVMVESMILWQAVASAQA